uniref:RNA helicase n=1 Tax=Oryza glumipatula TaxID=40148 RepID=A0A0E0BBK8_9ORYZ
MLVHSSARRLLVSRGGGSGSFFPFAAAANACSRRALAPVSASAMSYRGGGGGRRGGGGGPNSQRGRGRGGGGAGRGGGGGGRGGGGRGEQRWWDPQWRAERLRQMAGEEQAHMDTSHWSDAIEPVEKVDENEWWNKIRQLREGSQQELVVKRNFGRDGQNILADMAQRQGLYLSFDAFFRISNLHLEADKFHFHYPVFNLGEDSNAYNKGKTIVFSKVPLPDYRADLDERHGSTQQEIRMSNETERRVENLLAKAKSNSNDSASTSTLTTRQSRPSTSSSVTESTKDIDKERLSSELRDIQNSRKMMPSARLMQSFRDKLPAFKMREEFLKAVAANQVLVISGETGCGKTTQLPQFILEEEIDNLRGADCSIICTQPRRISAISVAARVASERGEELGDTVGYQIRLESKRSAQTRLLFCTTGVLLRRLEPDLVGVSHLLVDEIHERGMNEDFLIIILRDLLPRRQDLRLVLMSATINAELFSKYFGEAPIMHIPGFTFPVTELFLEDILEKTRYKINSERDNFQGNSRRKRLASVKSDPISDAFEDVDIYKEYGNYSVATRQSLEAWSATELNLSLVEGTIEYICRHEGEGAILVFLTGWDEISKLLDKIKGNNLLGNSNRFLVIPLHGSMPTVNQREIFDRPPANMRKIVLATNIAESSITIDDVVYVIDCGKAKETSYDALNKLACLLPSWISKASAHQRRGRAGRVQPGACYRLYPKVIYDAMPQFQLPEILRTPLQELCLTIKSLQLGAVASFLAKALQPPDPLSVNNAIELLKTVGALDDVEELTSLGRHLCTLPLDPNIGKMLLIGSVFQCLDPALTIAAALAYRNPFVLPIDRKEEADAVKRSFAGDSCSDHIALVKAFEAWKEARRSGRERSFCWENFLSPMTLQMMDDMRNQFFDLLSDIGFVSKTRGLKAYNYYGKDLEMVCAVLCAGLYPNVVQCKRRGKRTAFYTKDVGKVDIHPSSVNAGIHQFPLPYLVYSEKRLRGELDKLLQRKIEEPALDIFSEGKGVVAAAVELLHSQNVHH